MELALISKRKSVLKRGKIFHVKLNMDESKSLNVQSLVSSDGFKKPGSCQSASQHIYFFIFLIFNFLFFYIVNIVILPGNFTVVFFLSFFFKFSLIIIL